MNAHASTGMQVERDSDNSAICVVIHRRIHIFQNCKPFRDQLNDYQEIVIRKNVAQNEHLHAICGRLEVAGDVISGLNVKTIDGWRLVTFEIAGLSNFREKLKNSFCDGEVSDCGAVVNSK